MTKKATRKKHHPDYDPEIEAGSVYLTKGQAEALMLCIGVALRQRALDEPHYLQDRVLAAATALDNVFSLGVAEAGRRRASSSGKSGKAAAGSMRRRSRAVSR